MNVKDYFLGPVSPDAPASEVLEHQLHETHKLLNILENLKNRLREGESARAEVLERLNKLGLSMKEGNDDTLGDISMVIKVTETEMLAAAGRLERNITIEKTKEVAASVLNVISFGKYKTPVQRKKQARLQLERRNHIEARLKDLGANAIGFPFSFNNFDFEVLDRHEEVKSYSNYLDDSAACVYRTNAHDLELRLGLPVVGTGFIVKNQATGQVVNLESEALVAEWLDEQIAVIKKRKESLSAAIKTLDPNGTLDCFSIESGVYVLENNATNKFISRGTGALIYRVKKRNKLLVPWTLSLPLTYPHKLVKGRLPDNT